MSRTTTLGLPGRLDLDLLAVRHPVEDAVGDRDHGSVHGRVHVGPDRGADVEPARLRAGAALELVVADPGPVRAEEPLAEPPEDAGVLLRADGIERQRGRAGRVVADRGDAALVDRQLNPQRVVHRDDLRARRAGRQEPLGRRWAGGLGDGLAAGACECREEEDDESNRSDDHQCRQTSSPAHLCAFLLTKRGTSGQTQCFGPSHPQDGTRGLHQVQMPTGLVNRLFIGLFPLERECAVGQAPVPVVGAIPPASGQCRLVIVGFSHGNHDRPKVSAVPEKP